MTGPPIQQPDRIARNIQAMRDQGASEADIESYLTEHEGLKPEGQAPAPLIPPMTHAQSAGPKPKTLRSFGGGEEKAGVVHRALDEVPFATKGMAGLDALGSATKTALTGRSLTDEAEGKPGDFLGTLKAAYNQNYDARKQAIETFKEEHPTQSTVAAGVGILGPILATMGTSAAAAGAEKAPLLARLGQGAKLGAKYGVLQGASEAHGSLEDYEDKMLKGGAIGAVGGGVVAPIVGKAASVVGKPIGKATSAVSGYLAERFPEGRTGQLMGRLSRATGTKGAASERLGNAAEADQQAGFVPKDTPQGFPMIALDQAGPATEGVAENIAQRQGAGRSVLHTTLRGREEQMRPNVTKALEEGTGVKAGAQPLETRIADQQATADKMFALARGATEGMAVDTPSLRALQSTPIGKQALAWGATQKANRMSALPQVERSAMPEHMKALGVSEENWAKSVEKMKAQGITPPQGEMETLPDPEMLHYAKQYLAKVAKLGVHDGQGGALATQAQGALTVWAKIRNELPDVWRKADDATAEKFRLVDLANEGRNIFRASSNPATPNARKAIRTSLGAVEKRIGSATPEGQKAAQEGAASAAHSLCEQSGKNVKQPGRVFAKSPERLRQMRQAFPNDEAADEFQQHVGAYDRAAQQSERILGNSRTGFRNAMESKAQGEISPSAIGQAMTGHPLHALRQMGSAGKKAADEAARAKEDKIIADWLTSPDAQHIPEALKATILRRIARTETRKGLAKLGGNAAAAQRN